MTNEQAIAILRRIQEPEVWEPRISKEGFEAIEMAVNALKGDPCNGCSYLGESCVGEGCGKLTERKDGEA